MIKQQYIKDEFLFIEYDNGASVKVPFETEPKEVIPELPKNPLLELKKENKELKQQLEQCQQSIVELTALANTVTVPKV
ncbi:hypothetical protein G8S49_01575 [Clostridium botulinum C]|uniref:Uncharacterized protein n=2 Tax=Clostridium botulinum TaxID=1491 RepID=A0A9Q4Y1A2_CLOBO|nr:hypothetical protein [Clostridium botulinum]EGO86966.1 hypothetical protein CBCST_14901 [Clostridium botulinum C str. Stockholm]MCD3194265.1 hypothetical protein [Clostridium botulinum C]MCD3199106.1 hypothetical protein [Clostridium botulinum C]MCD3204581.1 hypothetical protein [Clostridium botulinum C]MCD3207924.1 hypothetical protein [Clostridium botulinum C]